MERNLGYMKDKDYNEDLYLEGFEALNKKSLVIYAEDPEFYSCYITPKATFYPTGMSCGKIREHIKKSSNTHVVGIVDGDFNDDFEHENLFKINFYSIENIALCHHKSLVRLKNKVCEYVHENFDKKFSLKISFDGEEFNLSKDGNRIDRQYDVYLSRKIKSVGDYIVYMNLKEIVLAYGKVKKLKFQKTLPTQIPKLDDIFTKNEFDRLINKILEYEDLDIPGVPVVEFDI